jgi:7-cyano-7-deazaguanine synthase
MERLEFSKKLETIERRSAVCTISGGLDSAVAAAMMHSAGFELHFLFFDWGQKTYEREFKCAQSLAEYYGVDLQKVEIPLLKILPDISLTQRETLTNAINEYVPNRNAIIESQAVAYAEYLRAGVVCIGSTGGDHICPDNSPSFINVMQNLINEGTMLKPSIQIMAPLMTVDKTEAVRIGTELSVPFELTWSCHNNIDEACGSCSNCEARLEAFVVNKIPDPITYRK